MEAWKEKNKGERFEKCFETNEENSQYGPVKCKTKTPKACSNEDEFWNIFRFRENTCKLKATGARRYVSYSKDCSRKGEENYFRCRNDGEKLPGSWGEFTRIMPGVDQTCIPMQGKVDLRFCRPSQNCVIVEQLRLDCDGNPWDDNSFGDIKLCEDI